MNALTQEPGRRVVLLLTDGYDTPDASRANVTFHDVRDRAAAEGTMVYAIGFAEPCSQMRRSGPWPGLPRFQRRGGPGRGRPLPPMPDPFGRRPGGRGPRGGPSGPPVADGPLGRIPSEPPDREVTSCVGTKPDPDLKELANVSGGGYFELSDGDDLGPTFTRVADELHRQYLLAFSPEKLDGTVHSIEVRVRPSNLTARARKSYLATEEP
jgi:VWFA-related protein